MISVYFRCSHLLEFILKVFNRESILSHNILRQKQEDIIRKPLNLLERENIQSKIANWFGIDFSKLQIVFISNLGTNAGVMVQMDNVRRKHLSFRKARIKMLVSDQVAETCDACDRTEDLRVLHFFIYADFYSDRKSIKTDKTIFEL